MLALSNKVNSLLRKFGFCSEVLLFQRKLIICFGYMIFSFDNMTCSKKVNYLLRKYDCSFRVMIYSKIIRGAWPWRALVQPWRAPCTGSGPAGRFAREARGGLGPIHKVENVFLTRTVISAWLSKYQGTCPIVCGV